MSSIGDVFKKISGTYRDEIEEDEFVDDTPRVENHFDEDYNVKSSTPKNNKFISIPATTRLSVIVVKPEKYGDAAEIADHFKNKKTVVLNLDNTNKDVANRLIDFLGGVAYASDGTLKRIANTTYIIVPFNVEISGDMIDELGNASDLF